MENFITVFNGNTTEKFMPSFNGNIMQALCGIKNNADLLKTNLLVLPIFSMYWAIQGLTDSDKLNTLYLMADGKNVI